MEEVVTAKYKITGFVNVMDANGEVSGSEQYPVGSVQELPVEYGAKAIALGNAELVEDEDTGGTDEDTSDASTGATGEIDE